MFSSIFIFCLVSEWNNDDYLIRHDLKTMVRGEVMYTGFVCLWYLNKNCTNKKKPTAIILFENCLLLLFAASCLVKKTQMKMCHPIQLTLRLQVRVLLLWKVQNRLIKGTFKGKEVICLSDSRHNSTIRWCWWSSAGDCVEEGSCRRHRA